MSLAPQQHFWPGRFLVWVSCGAPSAVAAKMAIDKYGDRCELLYCDTSLHEHPDNQRFLADVERWTGSPVRRLRSNEYPDMDINTVFLREGRQRNQKSGGAVCTDRLKRQVRKAYQWSGDVHIFGYTFEEVKRIEQFEIDNPHLDTEWILADAFIGKSDCLRIIREAGISIPVMYLLGYHNNNCIGCVKGGKGYWNKIRRDFPAQFDAAAKRERVLNDRILRDCFLDQLDPSSGRYDDEPDIECGAMCVTPSTNYSQPENQ